MRRKLKKLTPRRVRALRRIGRHSDGGNLYLSIGPGGRKRWVFLYARRGRQREMGLGSAIGTNAVPLYEARRRAEDARQKLRDSADPLLVKRIARVRRNALSFKDVPAIAQRAYYIIAKELKMRGRYRYGKRDFVRDYFG